MRRQIDSVYTAMPFVLISYIVAVVFAFVFRLIVSDLPLFSLDNLALVFAKKVVPYGEGFQILIAIWIGTGIVEKSAIKKMKKRDAEEEKKKEKLGKLYVVSEDGALIQKRRRIKKRKS